MKTKGMNITESNLTLTAHATERIRQRVGITSLEESIAWIDEHIANAKRSFQMGHKTHYVTDLYEIVCDGLRVVTIKPKDNETDYLSKLGGIVTKEVTKMVASGERELRKAEIKVAEHTLNLLKARNPKTKAIIQTRLVEATDDKQRIADEIYAIKLAAKRYGVGM